MYFWEPNCYSGKLSWVALQCHLSRRYVQKYGLPGPCDDFETVSMFIARKTGFWDGEHLIIVFYCMLYFVSIVEI